MVCRLSGPENAFAIIERKADYVKKVVAVIGGCGGLGIQLVKSHLMTGDIVYAYGLKISSEMKELMEKKETLYFQECDVSETGNVKTAMMALKNDVKRVDILYHTVGIYRFEDRVYLPDCDLDKMGRMFNVNAVGFLRILQSLWDILKDTAIICITSEAGSIGSNFRSWEYEYCMSKCAENMAAVIAQHYFTEIGNKSRIMCVHPGWLRTKMGGEEAFLHPEISISPGESAESIRKIAENINSFSPEVMYMDYAQNNLKW